jgi:hypothetical protein
MFVCRTWRVVLGTVVAALLLSASRVQAQSIVDARRVEFTPSPDHNTATVERYAIDVYVAGTEWPIATANLGKPSPETDGMIRVDFVSLLPIALQAGVTYEAVVEAIGPGGRSVGVRTNTFSFGGASCSPVVSPLSQSFTAAGGTGTSSVTTSAGCVWNATSSAPWITITSGASASGSGSVGFSVAANATTSARSGTLTIAGSTFTVNQAAAACSYSVSPTGQSFTAAGGTGAGGVTAGANCGWTATSNASWITITSGASGSGSGSTAFSVAANTATTSRTGTLTIAGATFTVTQAIASCSYSIASNSRSFAAAGGSGGTTVTAGLGCAWSATSNAAWIVVTSGASGSGPGTAGFSVAANTSTASRSGTLTIAGATFTVTQAGASCSYSASPTSQTFASDGGSGSSVVTAGSGCAWTASSNAAWIGIIAGATGSGSGSVAFTVAANTGTAPRTGTLTIAGSTFTVTQNPPSACSFSIVPTSRWFTADGGSGSSVVSAPSACAWSAESNVAWVAVLNAGPGKGSGKVTFIVATNLSGASRIGTLTIADQTFSVTQGGTGCVYTTSPMSQAFGEEGGTGSSAVSTSAGCGWEASSNATWITITSSLNGFGSGSVGFSVAANIGGAPRTGTLTIAGTTFTVTQGVLSSCTMSISPSARSFTSDGGSGNSTVTAGATCAWDAVSNTAWIAMLNPGPGKGTGTVTFIVASNRSGLSRTGTLTIAGKIFTVTQTATAQCTYSVSPSTVAARASAGTSSVSVTTQTGCAWSASGAPSWLTMTGGGSGPGTVTLTLAANLAKAPRTASLTIAGQSLTVTQSARLAAPANVRVMK